MKIKSKTLVMILLFVFVHVCSAQNTWLKIFKGEGRGCCVKQTADRGYVVLGWKGPDILLIRTDQYGDTLWTRTYSSTKTSTDCGKHVLVTENPDGFILCGETIVPGKCEMYVIRTNNIGDTLWTRVVLPNGSCNSITKVRSGGYAIGGLYYTEDNTHKGIFVRINESGDTLYTRTYDNEVYDIRQTADNGFVLACMYYVIKIDSTGNILWKTKCPPSASIRQTADRGYIATSGHYTYDPGESSSNIYLTRFSPQGNIVWKKELGNGYSWSHCVQVTSDSCYVLTGYTDLNFPCIIKTDTMGNVLWERKIKSIEREGNYIIQADDGGYVVTGSGSGNDSIFILKTDSTGNFTGISNIGGSNRASIRCRFVRNYPNPFNQSTSIVYDVEQDNTHAEISIYNVLGKEIRSFTFYHTVKGRYTVTWDGKTNNGDHGASGIYICKIKENGSMSVSWIKLVLIK